MSGLSAYNMCVPQIRSCFGTSKVVDSAYVPNIRYSSTGNSGTSREQSVGFWRSWEFLYSYSNLRNNKGRVMSKKHPRSSDWKKIRTLRVSSKQTRSEEHEPDGEDPKRIPDIFSRSLSLEANHKPSAFERKSAKITNNHEDSLKGSSSSDERINNENNRRNCVPHESSTTSEQPSSSGNIIYDKSVNKVDLNLPGCSKEAIPKCKNISEREVQKDDDSVSSEDGEPGFDDLKFAESEVSSSTTKCKKHDLKNMTSLLHYNNQSLGKDVIDNGATLLSPRLQVNTVRDRLKTFKNWPNRRIDPKTLADAGFFYCGRADIVECFRCGIKGHNWVENDKPMEDHMRWNQDCPFVRENTTQHDNVQVRQGQDICGNLGVEILPNSRPEDVIKSETSLEKLGLVKTKDPSHPDQIMFETRLATFENWPKSMKQKPPELAAAGFYYLGVGDQTLCFYCGGGLKDWVEEDDPWEQHALWFPKCNFLLLKRTPAFVDAVHKKHKGILSSEKEETETQASCSTSNSDTKETPSCQCASSEERNAMLCKICFKNELSMVFLPCGHIVACVDCALSLKECVMCRKPIEIKVRGFIS